jgi:hypothetical protein
LENSRATDVEKIQGAGLADFIALQIEPEERRRLMEKVQKGKRLTRDEAIRVCAMLLQIIEQDEKARSDATMFLAALSARYGIEINVERQ